MVQICQPHFQKGVISFFETISDFFQGDAAIHLNRPTVNKKRGVRFPWHGNALLSHAEKCQ